MPVEVFISYAHEDEQFLKQLRQHLAPLQRQGLVRVYHDRNISAGALWKDEIDNYLHTAQIILLLVSPSFMASDYCYSVEMQQAIERHEHGEICIIPIILRPVYDWQSTPFGAFQAHGLCNESSAGSSSD